MKGIFTGNEEDEKYATKRTQRSRRTKVTRISQQRKLIKTCPSTGFEINKQIKDYNEEYDETKESLIDSILEHKINKIRRHRRVNQGKKCIEFVGMDTNTMKTHGNQSRTGHEAR